MEREWREVYWRDLKTGDLVAVRGQIVKTEILRESVIEHTFLSGSRVTTLMSWDEKIAAFVEVTSG